MDPIRDLFSQGYRKRDTMNKSEESKTVRKHVVNREVDELITPDAYADDCPKSREDYDEGRRSAIVGYLTTDRANIRKRVAKQCPQHLASFDAVCEELDQKTKSK